MPSLDMNSQTELWFAANPRGQSTFPFPNVDPAIRDNYCFNVRTGIEQELLPAAGSAGQNARLLALRNIMQLDTSTHDGELAIDVDDVVFGL